MIIREAVCRLQTGTGNVLFLILTGRLRYAGGCTCKGQHEIGNDKELLMRVISQSLPYIGYPRCLNAVNCVNEAERQMKQE